MRFSSSILIVTLMLIAAPMVLAADQTAPVLLDDAKKALEAKDYDRAIDLYQQSHQLLPLNAEIPYNLAVAQYRKGEYDKAAESLKQAISLTNDANLRARSTYNLGNSAYAQTLKAMAGEADPQKSTEQMNDAQQYLKEAIDNYKKAIDAAPSDEDAKANAELSQRLLTELQKLQQQQQKQQQQQQQQDQKDQSQQQQTGPQSQPQPQPDQNQQQQQQKQDQSQSQQQQDQKQSEDKESQDQKQDQKNQEQQKPDPKNQDKDQPPPSPDDQKNQQADETKGDKQGMTREAAKRLLQAVRDKEKQRRAELARREAAKYAPVEKDW